VSGLTSIRSLPGPRRADFNGEVLIQGLYQHLTRTEPSIFHEQQLSVHRSITLSLLRLGVVCYHIYMAKQHETFAELDLPDDWADCAKWVADALWTKGLHATLAKKSDEPYMESVTIWMGNSREGVDAQFIETATQCNWYDLMDDRRESNLDYIEDNCKSSFEMIFSQAISARAELGNLWSHAVETLSKRNEDFDEDELKTEISAALYERARDEGVGYLFDIEYDLSGSSYGKASREFAAERGAAEHDNLPALPHWHVQRHAKDWADMLSWLGIHPLDFAKKIKERFDVSMKKPETWADMSISEASAVKRAYKEMLAQQGISGRISSNPAQWTGGMLELAKAWSRMGASLPAAGTRPLICIDDFLDALQTDPTSSMSFELELGIGSKELKAHSELINRFGSDSPIHGEQLAAKTLMAAAQCTLNGEDIQCCGSFRLHVDEIRWTESRADDESISVCMSSRREAARLSSELVWHAKDASARGTSKSLDKAMAHARKLAGIGSEPHAFSYALKKMGDVSQEVLKKIMLAHEQETQAREAHLVKIGKPVPISSQSKITLEDFQVFSDTIEKAPWRIDDLSTLIHQRDSLGNSLAHKAAAALDDQLLLDCLLADPSLADSPNLGGMTPFESIFRPTAKDQFIKLASAVCKARPDLVNKPCPTGKTFLTQACSRGASIYELTPLLDAGAMWTPAAWVYWSSKDARQLKEFVESAQARGWDINQTDGTGKTLAHLVTSLECALILHDLGANLSIKDHDGQAAGCSIYNPAKRAELDSIILSRITPAESGSKSRVKSL